MFFTKYFQNKELKTKYYHTLEDLIVDLASKETELLSVLGRSDVACVSENDIVLYFDYSALKQVNQIIADERKFLKERENK
jgi:hypothetical protein